MKDKTEPQVAEVPANNGSGEPTSIPKSLSSVSEEELREGLEAALTAEDCGWAAERNSVGEFRHARSRIIEIGFNMGVRWREGVK